jgi:hypothetical protein
VLSGNQVAGRKGKSHHTRSLAAQGWQSWCGPTVRTPKGGQTGGQAFLWKPTSP